MLAGVEVPAEEPEPDGRLGAALRPDHAGRPRAGAGAEGAPLDQDHVGEAGLAEEPRAPGADGAATHDDGVGGRAAIRWSRLRAWHRLNSQSMTTEAVATCTA